MVVVVLAEVDGVVAEKAAGVEEVDEVAAVVRRLLFSKRGKGKKNTMLHSNDFTIFFYGYLQKRHWKLTCYCYKKSIF